MKSDLNKYELKNVGLEESRKIAKNVEENFYSVCGMLEICLTPAHIHSIITTVNRGNIHAKCTTRAQMPIESIIEI
jgi:REP element-mobilizing transposase RayT